LLHADGAARDARNATVADCLSWLYDGVRLPIRAGH